MIHIEKGSVPELLQSASVQAKRDAIENVYQQQGFGRIKDAETGVVCRVPGLFSSDKGLFVGKIWSSVKSHLVASHFGKCAYCEARLVSTYSGDVEHFRPKAGHGRQGRPLNRTGYFWMAYDWDNYWLACAICNQTYKKNYFDQYQSIDKGADDNLALTPETREEEESPLFVSPAEKPREFIRFDPYSGQAFPAPMWDEIIPLKGGWTDRQQKIQLKQIVENAMANAKSLPPEQAEIAGQIDRASRLQLKLNGFNQGVAEWDAKLRQMETSGLTVADPQVKRGLEKREKFQKGVLAAQGLMSMTEAWLKSKGVENWREIKQPTPSPQQVIGSQPIARAWYSIVNLGLNRSNLVNARVEHLIRLRGLFLFVRRANRAFTFDALWQRTNALPAQTSDEPFEIDAALDSLAYSMHPKAEYSSLATDALYLWCAEAAAPQTVAIHSTNVVDTRLDPWLQRYYNFVMAWRPVAEKEAKEGDEDGDDDSGDDDDEGGDSAQGEEFAPNGTSGLTEGDYVELCMLKRFGQSTGANTSVGLAKQFGLYAAERRQLDALYENSGTHSVVQAEVVKKTVELIGRNADYGSIVERCLLSPPKFLEATINQEAYWMDMDKLIGSAGCPPGLHLAFVQQVVAVKNAAAATATLQSAKPKKKGRKPK